jgi:hypothetical protein
MLSGTSARGSCDPRTHSSGRASAPNGVLDRRPLQVRAWHHHRAGGPPSGASARPRSWLAGTPLRQRGTLQPLRSTQELSGLIPLSQDVMTFLASTVFVIPVFRRLKVSPILGYLLSGLILQKFGWVSMPRFVGAGPLAPLPAHPTALGLGAQRQGQQGLQRHTRAAGMLLTLAARRCGSLTASLAPCHALCSTIRPPIALAG